MKRSTMTNKEKVIEIIARHTGRKPEGIQETDILNEDLGLDELDMVEMCMALEDEFNIEITDETEEQGFILVSDVIKYVEEAIAT